MKIRIAIATSNGLDRKVQIVAWQDVSHENLPFESTKETSLYETLVSICEIVSTPQVIFLLEKTS